MRGIAKAYHGKYWMRHIIRLAVQRRNTLDNGNIYWKKNITLKRNNDLEIIAGKNTLFWRPEVAELIRQHHMTSKIYHYISLAILLKFNSKIRNQWSFQKELLSMQCIFCRVILITVNLPTEYQKDTSILWYIEFGIYWQVNEYSLYNNLLNNLKESHF